MDWIMKHVKEQFLVRLTVAALTIGVVVIYLRRTPLELNDNMEHIFLYQNVWLYSSFVVAFLNTGLVFVYVLWMSFDYVVPFLKGPAILALAVTVSLGTLLFIPLMGSGLHNHPLRFHGIAVVIPIAVYFIDWALKNTHYFPEMKEKWDFVQTFDLAVVFGTASTFFICWFLEHGQGFLLSSGFAGGAITFQLIMANLLFDPTIYRIELPSGQKFSVAST